MGEGASRYVFSSRNPGKLAELRHLLRGVKGEFVSAADLGVPEIAETGDTFEANAEKKAVEAARATGLLAIADDSGLCVDALDGAPGVHSARYSEAGTDVENRARLIREVAARGLVRPRAKFVCVVVLASPDGALFTARGEVEGEILSSPRGTAGFGYDPLFFCPEIGKAFGEATREEKARVSHRGRALSELRAFLLEREHS